MQLDGFEFDDIAGLRSAIAQSTPSLTPQLAERKPVQGLSRLATWPIYRSDAVLRRATALLAHPLNRAPAVRLNADEAQRHGLGEGDQAKLANTVLPVVIDASVPDGAVWIEAAHDQTATLP